MNSIYEGTKRENAETESTKRFILALLISLTVIQQMPIVKEMLYTEIRTILYIGFGVFSAYSFFNINRISKHLFVKFFFLITIYSFILFVIVNVFNGNSSIFLELLIPFGILICSLNTTFNKRQVSNLLIWYVILSLILGLSSIVYYGSGLLFTGVYFLPGKNQIGPILGISTIIIGIYTIDNKQLNLKNKNTLMNAGIFIMLFISLLIIRNRASVVGVIIVMSFAMIYTFDRKITYKKVFLFIIISLMIFLGLISGVFDNIINTIIQAIIYNPTGEYDLNSISSGRIEDYRLALEFVKNYPIAGEIEAGFASNIGPHNYVLYKWVAYGVVFSFPIIIFYTYLWFFNFVELLRTPIKHFNFPIWILLFSLIVSLLEYTYPYGPGVSQIVLWFSLGQYIKLKMRAYS